MKTNLFKTIFFLLAIFFLLPNFVNAAPSVSGIIGTITNGQGVTIVGDGFGAKTMPAAFTWYDFENGIVGNPVAGNNGWVEYQLDYAPSHKYWGTNCHNGKCARNRTLIGSSWWGAVGKHGLAGDEVFYSVWFRFDLVVGSYVGFGPVGKLIRINSQPAFYQHTTSCPNYFWTFRPALVPEAHYGDIWNCLTNTNGTSEDTVGYDQIIDSSTGNPATPVEGGAWGRADVYAKLSTAGVADGIIKVWWNSVLVDNRENIVTRGIGYESKHWENFLLPAMTDSQGQIGAQFDYFVDDAYIDTTQSRVELCTGLIWINRGHCEVQPTTLWDNNGQNISITINQGAFADGASAYLYVVDNNGLTNDTTAQSTIVFNGVVDTIVPAAPSGLSVL